MERLLEFRMFEAEEKEKYYIYTLTDPLDKDIKYIGKTKNLKYRITRHMTPYNLKDSWTPKNKWIIWLKNQGLKPEIEILDEGDKDNIDDLERFWIAQFKTWGYKLKNGTVGGDGFDWTGLKHSDETKMKLKMVNGLRRTICQYEIGTNELIGEYLSSYDAEKFTKFNRHHITKCCRGMDNYNSVGGFYWRYKDDYFPYKENKIKDADKKSYSVEKYDKNMNLVCVYDSTFQARKEGNGFRGIKLSSDKNLIYRDHYWKLIEKNK